MRFPKTIALAGVLALASSVLGWAHSPASAAAASTRSLPRTTFSVTVQGNHLVNGNGQTIRLLGVNRSGSEYACAQGWGIFDGPSDATSIAAIAAWHTNVARVPLNEDCWLGINGVASAYAGANYQGAIAAYVSALHAAGLYAILELHWNAPGTTLATGQQPMPDADHSPAFWSSVAAAYKNDPAVIFDLYNEPYPDRTAAADPWGCWRDGCSDVGFVAAGMQSLVNAVRAAGATTQPIMLGGLGYSSDLSKWLTYKPTDPNNGLVGSFHLYNFAACLDVTCWSTVIAGVAAANPVVTGELGENDCAHTFIDTYMAWADTNGVSYLGWAWNPYDCSTFPSLITGYDGAPTAFGIGLRDHFASLASAAVSATSSGSPLSGVAPLSVGFSGSAAGGTAPYSYSWNFGDGSATSTVQSPTHIYAAAGNYSAVLTVTDSLVHTNSAPALSVSVTSLPGAPTVVSASPSDASADVSWTAPASNGNSAITGYGIIPYLNGTTAQTAQVFNSTATNQRVTGLANGSSYKFTVAAINGVGTGPESAKSNAATPARVPAAPSAPTAVGGDASAMLTWAAPSNGGSAITGYRVVPYLDGTTAQATQIFHSTATTEQVTGLTNGSSYKFTVAAFNGVGNGPESAKSNAVIPARVPAAPSTPTATAGEGSAMVSWTAPDSGGSAITGYRIVPYLNGATAQSVQIFNDVATSHRVAGLSSGSPYQFTVAAINAVGTGAESPKSNSVTPVGRFPVKPNPGETTPPARNSDPVAPAPPAPTPSRPVAGHQTHTIAPLVVSSRSSAALAVWPASTAISERRTHWTWGRITYS